MNSLLLKNIGIRLFIALIWVTLIWGLFFWVTQES